MNNKHTIIISAVGAAVAIGITGAAVASAGGGDDTERPITGDELTKASEAALAHTGEGQVTDTEVGDEDSYYEVEVTLDDGSQVDVQLDERFAVVDASADLEGETDDR